MISIIICSRSPKLPQSLVENIKNTIGCAYEWVVIDNSENRYSIFEAYNLGIKKSKGDYWCFVHDDVLFHTKGWGDIIFEVFESDEKIGLVGVAGAKVKTKMPSAWWDCPHNQKAVNMIQHFSKDKIVNWNYGFDSVNNVEVVVIDGVFMAMRRNENIRFNTKMKGFHNYDLNISLEHKKNNYKIIVTNEILIEHFSLGILDENWLLSTLKSHKIYAKYLPISIDFQNSEIIKSLEIKNAKRVVKQILSFGLNGKSICLWFNFFSLSLYSKFYLEYLNRIFK